MLPAPASMPPTSLQPMLPMLPQTPVRSQIGRNIALHLRYAIGIISEVPSQLALHNRLPWCHPRFYQIQTQAQTQTLSQNQSQTQMPRSMQDAFSSCALYLAKNTANAQVIRQCLNARLDDLLMADMAATSTVVDLVGYTQAILLYNIMAIFDADMDVRRVVEKTRGVLYASAQQLEFAFRRQTHSWDDWILAETARRTALIAHFFIHMYYHVIVGTPTSVCRAESLKAIASDQEEEREEKYWTVSPQLWEADSASEWAAARRTMASGHAHVTRIYHMDDMLTNCQSRAIAADVARDDFSQILVSIVLGIKVYDGWMTGAGVVTR